jgi:hypothetical protein
MDATTLSDRFNTLLVKFSALQADNIQLKARIQALESTNNIKYGVNEPAKQSYLSHHLIHVYTEDQIPYTLVGIWSTIFDFLPLTDYEQWKLRMQCKLFHDAIDDHNDHKDTDPGHRSTTYMNTELPEYRLGLLCC